MGSQMKIKFIPEGFERILCSEGAKQVCETAGAAIQSRANSNLNDPKSAGYKMSSQNVKAYGSMRNMTFVYTTDRASIVGEAENKALSKAVILCAY
jgi:hypothetical protein